MQNMLADFRACHLVCSFLSAGPEQGVNFETASRVARLGILLLQGGNTQVQNVFKRLTLADAMDNRRTELLEHLRSRLRECLSSVVDHRETAMRHVFATRLLRFIQVMNTPAEST